MEDQLQQISSQPQDQPQDQPSTRTIDQPTEQAPDSAPEQVPEQVPEQIISQEPEQVSIEQPQEPQKEEKQEEEQEAEEETEKEAEKAVEQVPEQVPIENPISDNVQVEQTSEQTCSEQQEAEEAADYMSQQLKIINAGLVLLDELTPIEMWDLYGENGGVKSYTRLDKVTGLKMARGEGVIHRNIEEVYPPVIDEKETLIWANNLVVHDLVEGTNEFGVFRSLPPKKMFITPRETLIANKLLKQEDGSVIVIQRSVDHPMYPDNLKEYVRALVYLFGWRMVPDKEDANKTHVTSIIYVNPKGWIPIPIFNAFIQDQAMTVKKLKDYLEKN